MITLRFNDREAFWPKSGHVTRSFGNIASESKLLLRATSLINTGFYQEALIVAFSVLVAKTQELIEIRISEKHNISKKQIGEYLRNIGQNRVDTMLNFLLVCIGNVSLKTKYSALFNKLKNLNNKRNNIVHNGENATNSEARDAVLTVAKVLQFFNDEYKASFDIPECLIDERKKWFRE